MKTNDIKNEIKKEAYNADIRKYDNKIIDNVDNCTDNYNFNKPKKPFNKLLLLIPSFIVVAATVLIIILVNIGRKGGSSDLELLSFERKLPTTENSTNSLKGKYYWKNDNIEINYTDTIILVCTVKNLNRYSFIDLVVNRSDLGTKVVYNEGNGKYQCSSETKYQDNMWVTIIEFELKFEQIVEEGGTVSVDSINFLSVENKMFTAGLSYAKSKEISYTYNHGSTHYLDSNLYDSDADLYLDSISTGIIKFYDDVEYIDTKNIDISKLNFKNLKIIFNDIMDPFGIPAEYYLQALNTITKDGGIYLPSNSNNYYALLDIKTKDAILDDNVKYLSNDIGVEKCRKNSDGCYYLSTNNNEFYSLIACDEDAIVDYDMYETKPDYLLCQKLIFSPNSDLNYLKYDFNDFVFNGSLDEYFGLGYGLNIDGIDRKFYLKDVNGNIKIKNNNYIFPTELEIKSNIGYIPNYSVVDKILITPELNQINDSILINSNSCALNSIYYDGTIEDWLKIKFGSIQSNPMYFNHGEINFYINDSLGDVSYKNKKYKLLNEIVIPDGTLEIGNYQFYGFRQIEKVVLNDELISIGKSAFASCGFSAVSIPNGVKIIESGAFNGQKLESVNIPNSIEFIGNSAFGVTINTDICTELGNCYYLGNSNNPYYFLVKAKRDASNITINPNAKVINNAAFAYNTSVENIIIPEGVYLIGNRAFDGCTALKTVSLPSTLKYMYGTFTSCQSLTSLVLPDDILALSSSLLSHSLLSLRDSNFSYNEFENGFYIGSVNNPYMVFVTTKTENIKSINIHKDTKFILNSAFDGCTELECVNIPEGVISIGSSVFISCFPKEVIIPTTIEKTTFRFYNIEKLIITNKTEITASAFESFTGTVYYKGTSQEFERLCKTLNIYNIKCVLVS